MGVPEPPSYATQHPLTSVNPPFLQGSKSEAKELESRPYRMGDKGRKCSNVVICGLVVTLFDKKLLFDAL